MQRDGAAGMGHHAVQCLVICPPTGVDENEDGNFLGRIFTAKNAENAKTDARKSNIQVGESLLGCWALGVGCWALRRFEGLGKRSGKCIRVRGAVKSGFKSRFKC